MVSYFHLLNIINSHIVQAALFIQMKVINTLEKFVFIYILFVILFLVNYFVILVKHLLSVM